MKILLVWINHNISYIKFRNINHKICDLIKFILKYKILNKLKLIFFLIKNNNQKFLYIKLFN